jgi:predicted AAA+ superfamily ATPase
LTEIHFLRNALGDLKKIHDFLPDIQIIFTGSVAPALSTIPHTTSPRRVRIYPLEYFSFREFLAIRHGEKLEKISFDESADRKYSGRPLAIVEAFFDLPFWRFAPVFTRGARIHCPC